MNKKLDTSNLMKFLDFQTKQNNYVLNVNAKLLVLNNPNNVEYINNYRTLNKIVKLAFKNQRVITISEMEENFKKNNSHKLFKQVR